MKSHLGEIDEGLSGKVGKDELSIELDQIKQKIDEIEQILQELIKNQEDPAQIKELKEICAKLQSEVDTIKGRLDDMAKEFSSLLENVAKLSENAEGMGDALKKLARLEEGFKELSKQASELMADSAANRRYIEELQTCAEELKTGKADKDELDKKADVMALDAKVEQSQYDTTIEELNTTLQDLLSKYGGNEEGLKKAIEILTSQMEEKLSRTDFDTLAEPILSRIQALMASLKKLRDAVNKSLFADAAGITKCISCGRPARLAGREVSQSERRSPSPIEKCTRGERGSGVSGTGVSPYDPDSGATSVISLPGGSIRKEVDLVGYDGRTYKGCVKVKRHAVDDQDVTLDAQDAGGKKRVILRTPSTPESESHNRCSSGGSGIPGSPKYAFGCDEPEGCSRSEKGRNFRMAELVPQPRYTAGRHTTTMPQQRGNQYTMFKIPDSKSREEMGLIGFDRQMYHGSVKKKNPGEEGEVDSDLEQLLSSHSKENSSRPSQEYPRYCGGKHTVTNPQQRGLMYSKLKIPDDPNKQEVDLYGSDGGVYKGDVNISKDARNLISLSPPPEHDSARVKPSIVGLTYESFKKEVDLVGYDGRVYKGCIVEIPPNEMRRANRSKANRKHIYLPAYYKKK